MARKRLEELGSLQRAVLKQLWSCGEATVHVLRDQLKSAEGKQPAYTTVLSVLQKLEKLGWVDHRREGRTYVYAPRQSRRQADSHSLRAVIDRVFRGDARLLMQQLIEDIDLSGADLDELQAMIDRKRDGEHNHDDVD